MEKIFYYIHNVNESRTSIALHQISFFEITAVFKGELNYTINNVEIPVKAGDVIFIAKGATRMRKAIKSVNYISLNFYSDKTYDFPTLIEGGLSEIVRSLILSIDSIYKFTHNLEDERFSLLLKCILKQIEAECKVKKEHPLVVNIKKYVKNNLKEKLTLDSICNNVYFSLAYCEKIFKNETGITIIDYVINEKIRFAQMLLMDGYLPLIKIAELVGFDDYNYFSRLFKKRVGVSPLVFRKQNSNFSIGNRK